MDENYLVTKSNYFIMNSSYDLSLQEQKIILTLASMVQPTDKEFKIYRFKISEFMELVGVDTKTKYTQIPKITKELMKKVFEIEEGKKLIQVAWLSSVVYEKGTGYVELEFSPRLKPYMLKLNTLFTQYKLGNILNMKSKYSPRIYELLKCNEFKKQGYIEIEVDELRKILKTEDMYHQYQDFKRKVVIQAQKELKKISDISFDFEEIKTGRKVTGLKFHIKANKSSKKPIDEVCATREDKSTLQKEQDFRELINIVKNIFEEVITGLQAKRLLDTAKGDINIINEKYALSQNVAKIDNIVGWVIKAIKEDYTTQKGKGKTGTFNDYEQRPFDPSLENKLLGWENNETDEVGEEFQQAKSYQYFAC
jgi:plasmid replication initiation protein